jgi:alpha-beta hydrolase superfamily lysophospholipase
MQPCRGIAWWAHRDDVAGRGSSPFALFPKTHRIGRPPCLENPRPEGAEYSLTESAPAPFHAESGHLEEQYFFFVRAILERGYSCLSFEGPGQGSVIREQGLPFTHEWEKSTKAVLDAFLKLYERPGKIVMLGSSLGGYLAPRAAAFDSCIDGVVAFDVMFDFGESFRRKIPHFVQILIDKGFRGIARTLIRLRMRTNTTVRWGIHNAQWTLGVNDPVDVANAMSKFNIRDVAGQIHCPVLLLRGAKDHLVPAGQMERMKSGLVNAKASAREPPLSKKGAKNIVRWAHSASPTEKYSTG